MNNKIKTIVGIPLLLCFAITCNPKQYSLSHGPLKEFLKNKKINQCYLIQITDYNNVYYQEAPVVIMKEEVEERVKWAASLCFEKVEVKNRYIIEEGDVIQISFLAESDNGDIITRTHDQLIVGQNSYFPELEERFIGADKRDQINFRIKIGDNTGTTSRYYQFSVSVEGIYKFVEHDENDPYVWDTFDVSSKEELIEYCKNQIETEKKYNVAQNAEKELFHDLIDKATFFINEKEVAQYSTLFVEETKQLADIYNKTLEEYIKDNLREDEESFYQDSYNKGEEQVKEFLIVDYLINALGFSETEDIITDEQYKLLRNKIIDYFRVPIENRMLDE